MITLIVPTRNRAHALRMVAESYYQLDLVDEIIFVNDAGTDDTPEVIAGLAAQYPQVRTRHLRNRERLGAAGCRNRGIEHAANSLILFSDDDMYLEPGYAETCLRKMRETGAAIVSGRKLHKRPGQSPAEAVVEFGYGRVSRPPFRFIVCEFREDARFVGDMTMPLTNSAILTSRVLLRRLGYDSFYSRGNGFREESDFQMNVFVRGGDILTTNDTHCIELSRQENPSGGQRIGRLSRLYWAVYYTNYFYRKYFDRYAARVGLRLPRHAAVAICTLYQVWFLFVMPLRHLWPERLRPQVKKRTAGASFSHVK